MGGDPMIPNDPLTIFEQEHAEALRELERLERAALAAQDGANGAHVLETLRAAHRFLSQAVRQHNEKEERALFPVLGDAAPTQIFEDEHVRLRALEDELLEALEASSPAAAVRPSLAIVALLRAHIERENEVLFPMARELLGPDGLAEVYRRLDV